jgi:predicted nucleic acid-binding Zn ribbon protein
VGRPQKLGDHLQYLIRDLGLEKRIQTARIFSEWDKWLGRAIASQATPQRLEHGRLYVRVKSDTWRQEMIFHKRMMIDKINSNVGTNVVRDILFT